MSRWFRHYAGMMRDEKLVSAALKSKQSVERVIWVWGAILESAAEVNDDGKFALDTAEAAYFLRADQADLDNIVRALEELGRIANQRVAQWGKRQFASDKSAERTRAYRQRGGKNQRDETDGTVTQDAGDGDVTSPQRHGDAPETETETETETELDTKTEKKERNSRTVAKATRPKTSEAFEEFWKAYPRRLGANPKAPAFKVFDAAVKQGADPAAIVAGARRCAAADHDKIGTPYIPQAVKWLRDQRWNDYAPDTPGPSTLSDDERRQMFEKLRGTNGKSEGKGTDLRGVGAGAREGEGPGRQEPTADANGQTRHTGMAGMGAVFRDASGVRAGGDETGPTGLKPRIYRTG